MDQEDANAKLDRLRRAADERTHEDERSKENAVDEQERDELAAGRRATSAWGWLANPTWWVVVGMATLFLGLSLVVGLVKRQTGERPRDRERGHEEVMFSVDALSVVGALALGILVARKLVSRATLREREWRAAQPFPVGDHLRFVGSGNRAKITVVFCDRMPDEADWTKLAAGASGDLVIASGEFYPASRTLTLDCKPEKEASKRRVCLAFHDVVEGLLVPIHTTTPIESVTISS